MTLKEYLEKSPTAFHAVANAAELLKDAGAIALSEKEDWQLETGKTYFVIRNDSALIAFTVPENAGGFRLFASHGDSPCFKIKEHPEIKVENTYVKLNVEKYGGMLNNPWFDRPLSVAGRVIVKGENGLETKLVNIDRDLLVIPNLAIHMNREANSGFTANAQEDLLPLFGGIESAGTFMTLIAENAGVKEEDILGHDLFVYARDKGTTWGGKNEFFSAPRIDDLQCAYGGLMAFMKAEKKEHISVFALFDNEEVGSSSRQGAASTFLQDTVLRISAAMGDDTPKFLRRIADSFMVSADNGHAVHPNKAGKTDPTNRPVLNGGIVLKYSANQRYTTDGVTAAMFKDLCNTANVPYQVFFNRSDMMGGSTLGNLSILQVAFPTVDIGLPQLAMHSAFETAGTKDTDALIRFGVELFK